GLRGGAPDGDGHHLRGAPHAQGAVQPPGPRARAGGAGMSWTAGKVRSLAEARAWRQGQAGAVVFADGVFDRLHPGHVDLLEAARSEGGALVVGVNSDASARRLGKGAGRPVASEAARARVLAGLAAVDCVVLFDEDTPLALIEALRPDVLAK